MKFYEIVCRILFALGYAVIMTIQWFTVQYYKIKVCIQAKNLDEAKEMYIGYMAAINEISGRRMKTWCRFVSGIEL